MNQYTDTSYPTESFSYDRDGNMTADGTYAYTWDGENRLISVAPVSSPVNGDKKLEFKYDYMGRRVEKIYSLHNGSAWVEQTHERFVYDQWNVIMVLNGNSEPVNQTLRKYTWGLDMSGLAGSGVAPGVSPVVSCIHSAGGISGLLAGEEMSGTHQGSYWYLYDGNGNVGQILKYEAGSPPTISTAAYYEYDPYGNIIGPDTDNDGDWQDDATEYAKANPIRFSTKWFDESGLGYWGYRYYSPRLGRWMSRDPIEEIGNVNLYNFISNTPSNNYDKHGLITSAECSLLKKPKRAHCLCLNMLLRGCECPTVLCECCTDNRRGSYDPLSNHIYLCYNHLSSTTEAEYTYNHEYQHAWQHCKNSNAFKDCNHIACAEVQSNWCSGGCGPGSEGLRIYGTFLNCVREKAILSSISRCGDEPRARTAVNAALQKSDCKDCAERDCPSL